MLNVASEQVCAEIIETFVILSAILMPIKSLVASDVILIFLFEAVLSTSVLSTSVAFFPSRRRLLVLVTLAIFDSILSILSRRRVRALCKSILVTCNEDSGNAAVRNQALEGIEPGLF